MPREDADGENGSRGARMTFRRILGMSAIILASVVLFLFAFIIDIHPGESGGLFLFVALIAAAGFIHPGRNSRNVTALLLLWSLIFAAIQYRRAGAYKDWLDKHPAGRITHSEIEGAK